MLLNFVILVLFVAVFGAIIHPLALMINALPMEAEGLLAAMDVGRQITSNLLLWGLLGLIGGMGFIVLRGRLQRAGTKASKNPLAMEGQGVTSVRRGPYKIAVAITAYNEEQSIGPVVEDFRDREDVVRVIVIDNNSSDRTAEIAAAAGASVVSESRQGYGYACMRGLREGLQVLEADAVALVEGDGTFTGADLPKFQAYIGQADMVVGTRVVPGLVEAGSQMDHFFVWGNIFASMLLRLKFWDLKFLGAARISDLGCTFRVARRDALVRIIDKMDVGGNHFSPHMMMAALSEGQSIVEIPVTFRRRIGASKGASQSFLKGMQVGISMIWHIIVFRPMPDKESSTKETAEMGSRAK